MAIRLDKATTQLWRFIDAINQLVSGRRDSIGDVTLKTGQTSTVVAFVNCSKSCRVFLYPQTANAAAIVASTFVSPANTGNGQFTITHPSSASTDLSFSFQCDGG